MILPIDAEGFNISIQTGHVTALLFSGPTATKTSV